MTERPILFSKPMVLANLAGRKRQTRRIVKPQPQPDGGRGLHPVVPYRNPNGDWAWVLEATGHGTGSDVFACPYGKPGDRLWVRETWRTAKSLDHLSPVEIAEKAMDAGWKEPWAPIRYEADGQELNWTKDWGEWGKTRVSIHMPRWASRLTLEVTGVDVDRGPLTKEQALADGVNTPEEFMHLYEKINGTGSLDLWRWAISYRVVR